MISFSQDRQDYFVVIKEAFDLGLIQTTTNTDQTNVVDMGNESLVPNPATNQVTVNYLADEASSAYVMVVDMNTGNSDNYILDVQQTSTSIDISANAVGLYNVILVCDGEVQNSKNLIKQ